MSITCCIRYVLDPFQVPEFEQYAQTWLTVIPKCGGDLLGYFLPEVGTNNIAMALVSFANLTDYEEYMRTVRADPEGKVNFQFARDRRFILSEERSFLRKVEPAR